MQTLSPPRESSGWVGVNTYFDQLQLTAATKQDELWLILQSFSESKKRGLELTQKYGIPSAKREEAWQRFSSFIFQARNFWQAAQKTDNNSSPLLYYYCFLSLVKAYLVLNKFRVKNRMDHGLQFSVENIPDFLNQELNVPTQKGRTHVFSLYYKSIYRRRKPPQKLNLIKTLSYIPEIGSQYLAGGYGRASFTPCLHTIELE